MVDIYSKHDYVHLKRVNEELKNLEAHLGNKVLVRSIRMGHYHNGMICKIEGHLTEIIPFDYVGVKVTDESLRCNERATIIPFVNPSIIILDILDDTGRIIFENQVAEESFHVCSNKLGSLHIMSYYRRKLFGNIIADIDGKYRLINNGNEYYPKGINGLSYYEREIQKLDSVKNGTYSFNLTMTNNDVDIVKVPIYEWDRHNNVRISSGEIARVKVR